MKTFVIYPKRWFLVFLQVIITSWTVSAFWDIFDIYQRTNKSYALASSVELSCQYERQNYNPYLDCEAIMEGVATPEQAIQDFIICIIVVAIVFIVLTAVMYALWQIQRRAAYYNRVDRSSMLFDKIKIS